MGMETGELVRTDERSCRVFSAITAPIIGADRDKTVLATAMNVAHLFGAQVRALFIHPDARLAVPYFGEPLSPGIEDEIVRAVRKGIDIGRRRARAAAEEVAAASGVKLVELSEAGTTSGIVFQEVAGELSKVILRASRFSDLIVFGPTSEHDWADIRSAFAETVLNARRPVLIAPDVPGRLTGRVAIAWDGSIPAATTVLAAVPFLRRAASVEILSVADRIGERTDFSGVENYLAGHGIRCQARMVDRSGLSTGEALLDAAREADLLIMGAYGHSRLREMILGGVSRHVAWHATLPVFMMH